MFNTTIAPTLPRLTDEFSGTSYTGFLVKILLPAPALFVVIFAPIIGRTTDKLRQRNQIIIAAVVFAITGMAESQLRPLESILISRAILDICVVGLMTAVTSLFNYYYSEAKRSQFMGMQQTLSNTGGNIFIVTAGYLTGISARISFYIYAIAILLVPFVFFSIHDNGWKLSLLGCAIFIFCHLIVFYILPTQIPFFMADIGITEPSLSCLTIGMRTLTASIIGIVLGRPVTRIQNYGMAFVGVL